MSGQSKAGSIVRHCLRPQNGREPKKKKKKKKKRPQEEEE
jgi:hypothetical protein